VTVRIENVKYCLIELIKEHALVSLKECIRNY